MSSQANTYGSNPNGAFPPKGSTAAELKRFGDQIADQKSTYRCDLLREWGMANCYVQSIQWVQIDGRQDPRRAFRWTHQDPADQIAKPVQNEIYDVVDNEVGKLIRRGSKAYVRPRVVGSEAKRGGSKQGNEILNWHLEKDGWPNKRRRGIYKNVLYGVGIWKSSWLLDYRKTVRLGIPDAVRCVTPDCGFTLSKPTFPQTMLPLVAPEMRGNLKSVTEMPDPSTLQAQTTYSTQTCLKCGGPMDLAKLLPNEIGGDDHFGRPLGMDVPEGNAGIEVVSPDQFYPENEGILTEPEEMNEFAQVTPRSLDWIAAHFDVTTDEEGRVWKGKDEIKPEDPSTVAEYQLTLGDASFYGGGGKTALADRNVFKRHLRVKELYSNPTRRYPMGRMVVIAGNVVLMDDDLMMPSENKPGEFYPRVKYNFARFVPRDGEFFSQGITVPLISPQNRLNMSYSQIVDSRERHGVDGIMLLKGMRLLSPGWLKNFPGTAVVVEPSPEHPNEPWPQTLNSRMIDGRIYQEIDRTRDFIKSVSGQQDVDIGKAPQGVSAATAIQLLQEKASERRDQREQELRTCFQDLFSHQLLLLSEKVREPRSYDSPGQGKSWEVKEFTGLDLAGMTDVMVEEEASYDTRAFEREGIIQAKELGLYDFTTPTAQREALKAMGLPLTIADATNVQIEDAERKWFTWKNDGVVPQVDEHEDAHQIFWETYGKFLKSEDGLAMKEDAGMIKILPAIYGWEKNLQMAIQADAMARQVQATMEQNAQQGIQPDPMMPQMDPAQLQEMLLPRPLNQQIMVVWQKMIISSPEPIEPTESMVPFLNFLAVAHSHRLLAEGTLAQADAGAAQVAAPGAPMPGQPMPGGQQPMGSPAPEAQPMA